jgi:hypothetical protein
MGQELIAALDAYLNNEMEYLGKKNEKSAWLFGQPVL